ncbi:hypothetical protein F5X96DRAFT_669210 [Biscogniauxia mediterranea]|nr:hypothetical protein F5X96DRAFT_669210 [Biscogniauxia mediterranea]
MASSSSSSPSPSSSAQNQPAGSLGIEGLNEHNQAPRVFTLFPQLPLELRLMVWKAAMEPRTLQAAIIVGGIFTNTLYPHVLLYVCQESREVVLTHPSGRKSRFEPFYRYLGRDSGSYFDPMHDTLLLSP